MKAISTAAPFTYAVHAFKSLLPKNTPLVASDHDGLRDVAIPTDALKRDR
jgi:hypothetical protein